MAQVTTLEPTDTVRLVVALNRAWVAPFDSMDWQSWGGASEGAHTVIFQPHDHAHMLKALGLEHVPGDYVTVILDQMGVSWNIGSPVNGYAWMVQIQLNLGIAEGPTAEEFWQVDSRSWGLEADRKIATLPAEARAMLMACPYEARAHALAGYLQSVAPAPEPAAKAQSLTAPEQLRRGTVYLCRGETDAARYEEDGTPVGTTEWLFCDAPVDGAAGYSENHLRLLEGLDQFRGCAINTAAASFSPLERSTFNMWAELYGAQSTWTPPADRVTTTDQRPAAWVARANARREQANAG